MRTFKDTQRSLDPDGAIVLSTDLTSYSVKVLSSSEETHKVAEIAEALSGECRGEPIGRFYLASNEKKLWVPYVVAVSQGASIVGIVYAKMLKFAGVRTGLVFGDASLDGMVIAKPGQREAVFELGIRHFLDRHGFLGLRILVPSNGYEQRVIAKVLSFRSLDVRRFGINRHWILDLAPSYESYVAGLGPRTRRDFRHDRRQFESFGEFVPAMSLLEFRSAALRMLAGPVKGVNQTSVDDALRTLGACRNPLLVALRRHDGEVVSIIGGWCDLDCAVVFIQMNSNREFPKYSLSLVARAYLIEALIAKGIRRVVFWGGIWGSLTRYVYPLPTLAVFLDNPGFLWRTSLWAASKAIAMHPRWARYAAYIAPKTMTDKDDD
jgi:hypothetical protein